MIVIDDVLISDELIEEQFVCKLEACKGACCWEGDYGAPLEDEEVGILKELYPRIQHLLTEAGNAAIQAKGTHEYFPEGECNGATLQPDGACAYLAFNELGIAQCGIELAQQMGISDFKKPISCHLYPVRVSKSESGSFEALNYNRWDICSAACAHGKELQVPLYRFVKDALIRRYGEEFYQQLDEAAAHILE